MVKLGGDFSFLEEPVDIVLVFNESFRQYLDRYNSIQPQLPGFIYNRHSTGTEFSHDLITRNPVGNFFALAYSGSDSLGLGLGNKAAFDEKLFDSYGDTVDTSFLFAEASL